MSRVDFFRMKSKISDIKNSLDRLHSRMKVTEEESINLKVDQYKLFNPKHRDKKIEKIKILLQKKKLH